VSWRPPDRLPSRLLIVVLAVPVVLGDVLTTLYFWAGCGLAENVDPVTTLCVRNDATPWILLPLFGAVVGAIAAGLTREFRTYRVLAAGLALALACGATIWVIGFIEY
jgi:hypothetical protein